MWNSTSLWSFDNNTEDSLSSFNGRIVNNATYKTPGINGYGSALSLDRNQQQYVEVPTYRDLTKRSFTVEMWFYSKNLTNNINYGLFGQHHASNTSLSLHYIIRSLKMRLGFYNNDLDSSTIIQIFTWYHVAFVYDNASTTQKIYLNGILDRSRSGASSYQGTSGSILIGSTLVSFSYFSG